MLKNRLEREIENAKRQLNLYEEELRVVEEKVNDLEKINQDNIQALAATNKLVQDKEKEVEEMSNKIKKIRDEHGSSDAKHIKLLETKVRLTLSQFFQNCKKHSVSQRKNGSSINKKQQEIKASQVNIKTNNQIDDIQEGSNADLQNLSSDRKFMNGGGANHNNAQQNKMAKFAAQKLQKEDNFDFIIKVRNGQQINDVPIDLTKIHKIHKLRDHLSKTYSIQKEFLFLYDESGNLLLDDMDLEYSLFPNVFKTIKNYVPSLTIEVKRQKTHDKGENNPLETLMTANDDMNVEDNFKSGQFKKNAKKKGNFWEEFCQKLPKILKSMQHLFENLMIIALIILFIINRYIGNDVINKFNLNNQMMNTVQNIIKNNDNPYYYLSSTIAVLNMISLLIANQNSVQFTPFLPSLAVQTRIKATSDCNIPDKHKEIFDFGITQNCVDYDSEDRTPFYTKDQSYLKYSTLEGTSLSGYILNIPGDVKNMPDPKAWIDYQTESVTFYLNFFNTPTQMAAQFKISISFVVTDGKIQNFSAAANSFTVQPETQGEKIISNFITGIASILLLFALVEYIGIYGQNTTNITVQLYKQRKAEYEKIRQQQEIDDKEFEKNFGSDALKSRKKSENKNNKVEDHQFKIIDLTWLYILIKRPEFFDIINIISLILILVQSGIYSSFRSRRDGIISIKNTSYVHLDSYISDEFIINMLTAINTLLLMLSFTKYLASWSFTLKIYSQIMTSFVKNSWSLLVVVVAIVLSIAFSWMTFIDSSIQHHDSFVYTLFLQIKATFFSSFLQELRMTIMNQPEMPPTIKASVFNPFVIIAMLLLQFAIHFCIFSFLASLMANSIHVTKERMEKISKEIKDFEKRKVVNQTTFFRRSIQNYLQIDNNGQPK